MIGMQEIIVILLIVAVLGLPALIAIGVVLWMTRKTRSGQGNPPLIALAPSPQTRLADLEDLRSKGLISEVEYQEKRQAIMDAL